jgi:type II secretory pathway pseudopilin PulG
MSRPRHTAGFTLLELTFALTIFILLVGSALVTYTEIQRAQIKADNLRQVQEGAQDILNAIAKEYRFGTTDYGCYANTNSSCDSSFNISLNTVNGKTSALAILNATKDKRVIFKTKTDSKGLHTTLQMLRQKWQTDTATNQSQWVSDSGFESGFVDFSVADLNIKKLDFYLAPVSGSPYADYADNQKQFQPKVTVILDAENFLGSLDTDQKTPFRHAEVNLQTSVSSRVYE